MASLELFWKFCFNVDIRLTNWEVYKEASYQKITDWNPDTQLGIYR
jgi:hypothetical protein